MCHRTRAKTRNRASPVSNNTKKRKNTRTKTRKPKYISLKSVQLDKTTATHQQKHLINLFPFHPQNSAAVDDGYGEAINDVHVASFLFDDASTTTTLNSLLSPESELDPVSNSVGDYSQRDDERVGSLVRAAMKKGKDVGEEERWVCYSEVVEKKESEEVASCTTGSWCDGDGGGGGGDRKLLSLKLDYEEILNAWSDKGSLFVEGQNSSQVVPDLHDPAAYNVHIMDGWGNVGNLWQVPEMGGVKVKEELGLETRENWKTDQRQASVLRYKEKRNNRLFSKRIRYEVRKLNAEKRPRLKGRFVKRN